MAIAQPQSMADLFDGLKGAKVLMRSKSMEDGFEGRVKIKKIEAQSTRNGPKLFVKYEVVESNDPEQWPAGLERTWKQGFTTSAGPEPALNNMLAFAVACAGIPADEEDQIEEFKDTATEMLKEAIQRPEENDFIDVVLGLTTEKVQTREGRDFMTHTWSP